MAHSADGLNDRGDSTQGSRRIARCVAAIFAARPGLLAPPRHNRARRRAAHVGRGKVRCSSAHWGARRRECFCRPCSSWCKSRAIANRRVKAPVLQVYDNAEHVLGKDGVAGSIPLRSTIKIAGIRHSRARQNGRRRSETVDERRTNTFAASPYRMCEGDHGHAQERHHANRRAPSGEGSTFLCIAGL
jgi:hypothetical protein